jgi:uncharacterized membrane protein
MTFVLAGFLIALGLVAYFGSDSRSGTALIPTYAGAAFFVVGLVATRESLRKHAMHGAMLLAVLGIAGTAKSLTTLPAMFSDPESLERPRALAIQAIMCAACVVYLALGVRSFIVARRKGAQSE